MEEKQLEGKATTRKRRRVTATHRWTDEETRVLVDMVRNKIKDNIEAFEKPIAQKFYEKLSENTILSKINWATMKGKMRYLKVTYMQAVQWKQQTGAGLLENGEEKSVTEYVDKLCPYFNELEEIFGQRKGVHPSVIIETSNVEGLLNNESEDIVVYDVDDFSNSSSYFPTSTPSPSDIIETEIFPNNTIISTQSLNNNIRNERNVSKEGQRKKSKQNGGSVGLLFSMHEKKFELETKKFAWTKEKESKELEQQMQLKKMEIESNERLAMAKLKLESELEEKLRKYEMELKLRNGML